MIPNKATQTPRLIMDRLREWAQILRLAKHINANLPPKDGKYHAISFNIKLSPRKK